PNQNLEGRSHKLKVSSRSNRGTGVWMSICALAVLPAIAWALPRFDSYSTKMPDAEFEFSTAKTNLVSPDLRWVPNYPGTVWEDRFAITTDGGIVIEIYSNRYNEQSHRGELISRESYLFDPMNFVPESTGVVDLLDSDRQLIRARNEVLLHSSGTSWLAMYTYFVDIDPVASARRVQLMTASRSFYSRASVGIVAVATPCFETCESRHSDLEKTLIQKVEDYREVFSE
ncbi:MAG: hypothetical protein RLN85_10355, partial [Pseudomonadales bacterium]